MRYSSKFPISSRRYELPDSSEVICHIYEHMWITALLAANRNWQETECLEKWAGNSGNPKCIRVWIRPNQFDNTFQKLEEVYCDPKK